MSTRFVGNHDALLSLDLQLRINSETGICSNTGRRLYPLSDLGRLIEKADLIKPPLVETLLDGPAVDILSVSLLSGDHLLLEALDEVFDRWLPMLFSRVKRLNTLAYNVVDNLEKRMDRSLLFLGHRVRKECV